MYDILIPVDDEELADRQATFVADLEQADRISAVVAHAYRDESRDDSPPELSPAVRRAVDRLEAADVRTRTTELYVPVTEAILDTAADVDADLIVLGGRKRSPAGKALLGSVTQSVLLESSVPVVVVG